MTANRAWLATLDSYANQTYGRPVWSAVVEGACVCCGRAVHPFNTTAAETAFAGVGLCERCQLLPDDDDDHAAALRAAILERGRR